MEAMLITNRVIVFFFSFLGGAYTNVQLKVAGDVQRFTNMDVEIFKQILADNCGNTVKYTTLTGINNGCVKLIFQIPASCKNRLLEEARMTAMWLVENGIFQVSIGEETVDLPKVEHQEQSPGMMSSVSSRLISL